MSQTETLLLIVLGFAVASLLALFIGRFAWNTALRLGAKRMQRQVPSTVAELQSERDRLRAEYAMLSQRLGNRLEAIKSKMAEQMAEVTRHRNRLEVLRADLATSESEIVSWKERVSPLEQEIEQRKIIEAALRMDISELRAELGHRDQKISALDSELVQATSRESEAQERLRQRIAELTSLSQQIATNRQQFVLSDEEFPAAPLPAAPMPLPAPVSAQPLLDENFADAERETLDLERELALLDESWGEKLTELEKKREAAPDNIIALSNRIRQQQ